MEESVEISSEVTESQPDEEMGDGQVLVAPSTPKNAEQNQEEGIAEVELPVALLEETAGIVDTDSQREADGGQPIQASPAAQETPVDETSATAEQTFQHVELHIVDSDEEAAELRVKLLAAPDQNVHLLACARELHVTGIVPTQMDAMAGSTPLFTYVLSTDFMGAAQEIARSLVSGVESAQQQHDAEMKRTRSGGKATKLDKSLDIYDFDDDGKTKPAAKRRKKPIGKKPKRAAAAAAAPTTVVGATSPPAGEEGGEDSKKGGKKSGTQIKCLYCTYSTSKKYLLIRHMRCHSDERPHLCTQPGCTRAFKTTSSLQNHVNTHGGIKPHACKFPSCGASFTTSGELVRHSRYKHTHEKPHKCTHEGCGYSSVEMSKLRRHLRSHTGERPFKCPHCDYASPDTYKLKRHLRVHTGEKPYECDICHHKFTQSNSMKAHRMIHDTVKPIFQCQLCPTKCSRKTDLKIHVQKLHQSDQPVVCKKCSKSFADRYLFNVHRKTDAGCGGGRKSSGSPKKGAPRRRKRRASMSSETTEEDSVDLPSDDVSGQEEPLPELEGGFHSVRCVLPGGDVVHIIHNGSVNESDTTTHVVALTAAQMAELREPHAASSQMEATASSANDTELTQGLRCTLLGVAEDPGDVNGIQNMDLMKILSEVGIKAPDADGNESMTIDAAPASETEPEPMTVEA